MLQDIIDGWPIIGIEGQHLLDQIFEFFGVEIWRLFLQVSFPEDIGSGGSEASVEWVIWSSSSEGWMFGNHDEQYDGSGEDVNFDTVILLA